MNDPRPMTRRWLARLSFSFMIIGFFLGWEGWKLAQAGGVDAQWRVLLYLAAAALSFVLGFLGVRERHR